MRFFPLVLAIAAAVAASLYFFSAAPSKPRVTPTGGDSRVRPNERTNVIGTGARARDEVGDGALEELQQSVSELDAELHALKSELQAAVAAGDRIPADVVDRLETLTARVDALAEERRSNAILQEALRDAGALNGEPSPRDMERTRRALSEVEDQDKQNSAIERLDRNARIRKEIVDKVWYELQLDSESARALDDIVARFTVRQDQLLDRLLVSDPAPSKEVRSAIYTEIRRVVKERDQEIQSLLGAEALDVVHEVEKQLAADEANEKR